MPPIETLINTSLSHTSIQSLTGYCAQPNAQVQTKNFSAKQRTKPETKQQRDKTLPKRQERAKETKIQKDRAKESPKRVASKDQQGEVPGPSFKGVCMSAGKMPNQNSKH